jgi:hypothetical protein
MLEQPRVEDAPSIGEDGKREKAIGGFTIQPNLDFIIAPVAKSITMPAANQTRGPVLSMRYVNPMGRSDISERRQISRKDRETTGNLGISE